MGIKVVEKVIDNPPKEEVPKPRVTPNVKVETVVWEHKPRVVRPRTLSDLRPPGPG